MTKEEMEEILGTDMTSRGLYNPHSYMSWNIENVTITLDGDFDAETLEAIAMYMKLNKK